MQERPAGNTGAATDNTTPGDTTNSGTGNTTGGNAADATGADTTDTTGGNTGDTTGGSTDSTTGGGAGNTGDNTGGNTGADTGNTGDGSSPADQTTPQCKVNTLAYVNGMSQKINIYKPGRPAETQVCFCVQELFCNLLYNKSKRTLYLKSDKKV